MFLQQTPPSSIHIGSWEIYWYGLMITLAILLGYVVALRRAARYDIEPRHIENIFLIAVPSAILGARLYHVLLEFPYYRDNPAQILNFRAGGLAIHGAIGLGLLSVWLYTRWKRLKLPLLLDLLAPVVALGQGVGRWGNYFNQELYGGPTDLPWKLFIAPENRIPEYFGYAYYHPTFLYESLLNFVSAGVLLYLAHRMGSRSGGRIFALYLVFYGVIRFTTEAIRIDEAAVLGPLKWAQVVSILILAAGLALYYFFSRRPPKTEPPAPVKPRATKPQKTVKTRS